MENTDYERGKKSAFLDILRLCLHELGEDNPEMEKSSWAIEREETISVLRDICKDFGDNDWPDDLHLADVLEKHLRSHLE